MTVYSPNPNHGFHPSPNPDPDPNLSTILKFLRMSGHGPPKRPQLISSHPIEGLSNTKLWFLYPNPDPETHPVTLTITLVGGDPGSAG